MNITKLGVVALATASLAVSVPALAAHHSNTLSKIGHTLSYGVRKDAKNVSIDTHRAIGHKSVVTRHHGAYAHKAVITPGGHIKPLHHAHVYRHVTHHHTYRHHTMMHHTMMHHTMVHHSMHSMKAK